MSELRAATAGGGGGEASVGAGAVGTGVDVVAELERVRANQLTIAAVVEELRGKYNAHTHGGAVAAPLAGEQAQTALTVH
ncbi:MAG: hypothetical protein HY332_10580 [Chloroflexi bacterium]|nr:hypothetical protein [Chloroflexota bacterium]